MQIEINNTKIAVSLSITLITHSSSCDFSIATFADRLDFGNHIHFEVYDILRLIKSVLTTTNVRTLLSSITVNLTF